MRDAELGTRVDPATLTTQPLPVEQPRAREFGPPGFAAQSVDRLLIKALCGLAVAQQRAGTGFEAEREVGAGGLRRLRQSLERVVRRLGVACARGRFDKLRQHGHVATTG